MSWPKHSASPEPVGRSKVPWSANRPTWRALLAAPPAPIVGWFSSLPRRQQVHTLLLALITIGAVVHQVVQWFWFIEDAAISFAYAKHLASGEGLVPFVGGERVEGYSNPAWVLVLAGMYAVGLELFEAVRWLQVGFTAVTVSVTYLATREIMGRESHVPVLAAAFLAANSQFAIWGSAGLENGLMNLLIATALWRMWVELRKGGWPWSAALWLLVALCRPEGILYAAIAGFLSMVFHAVAGNGVMPTLKWLVTFFVPWTGYQVVRYQYFAWPFPNTYYAKGKDPELIRWTTRSWKWSRRFAEELGQAYFLPVYLLGLIGHRRWRLMAAATAFLVIAGTLELTDEQRLLLPVVLGFTYVAFWTGLKSTEDLPPRWLVVGGFATAVALVVAAELLRRQGMAPNIIEIPVGYEMAPQYVLTAAALMLPLVAAGSQGWQARVTCWLLCMGAAFFAIWVQGDWMKGFRWYSVASVPGSILLAMGADSVALLAQEIFQKPRHDTQRWTWVGGVAAVAILGVFVPFHVRSTQAAVNDPDARPDGILKRVHFVQAVRSRLHHEGHLVDLDIDQGAHLYWSDFEMHDIAGLVDLPLGHHKFERAFVREYLFQEVKPHFAHVHGGWASNSRIPTHPEWRRDYIEIPGYAAGRSAWHIGNHVRRDMLLTKAWSHGDSQRVAFEGELVFEGFSVPSEPGADRRMYLEVGVSLGTVRKAERGQVRMIASLHQQGEVAFSFDVPLGYDWVPPKEWKTTEVFHGRFSPQLPADMVPGTYDLSVFFVEHDGTVLGVANPDRLPEGLRVADGDAVTPAMAVGELQFPGAVRVLSIEERGAAAVEDREAALQHARSLRCEDAEHSWWLARMHRPKDRTWLTTHAAGLDRALSACWALWSDRAESREARVDALVRARELDHWTPEYRSRASALADVLHAEGVDAREAEDWESAYRLFSDAVDVDRTRSWSRRYAEEMRAKRLGFDPETMAQKEVERERMRAESEERRAKAKADREERAKAKQASDAAQTPEPAQPEGTDADDANAGDVP